MCFDDIYLYATPNLGIVISQNKPYHHDDFVDNIAVIFKVGEPVRIQLVDAETYDIQNLTVPDEIVGVFLAKFLDEIILYFCKKNM